MNDRPLVSVIVTTYNRKELLKETIGSILNQTFINFELIVVDNFSDYDFFEYIQLFRDDRIKPFQNHNNGIIAINRNFGIKEANGKYIAFCDDDDLWERKKLKEQLGQCNKYHADMVFSICKSFDNVNLLSSMYGIFPLPFKVRISKEKLLDKNFIPLSTVLIKKDVLVKFNGFNTQKIYYGIEDYELWLRLIDKISIKFIPQIHTFYRVHRGMTQLLNSKKFSNLSLLYKNYGKTYYINSVNKTRPNYLIIIRNVFHKFCSVLINIRLFYLKSFEVLYTNK